MFTTLTINSAPESEPEPEPGDGVYPWRDATLKIQYTDCSNSGELPSGCKRYIAGDDTQNGLVDEFVASRNTLALAATNIKTINWDPLPDIAELYGWGKNTDHIYIMTSTQPSTCPDVFCNFVYDMVNASLKGCFADLNSTSMGVGALAGKNYFEFANDPFYNDTGKGYMYDYMKSLTLSREKMYLISSDYFTDMVRAFYVIPVNSNLMNSIPLETGENDLMRDRTDDEVFNMNDFFELVFSYEWNYDAVAAFSAAISRDTNQEGGGGYDIRDRVGFAIDGGSGLCASGMLYTTSVVIIEREFSEEENEYVFRYPATNPELVDLCDKLTTLFSQDGIVVVNSDMLVGTDLGSDASNAILKRFTQGEVLFGNVICVGALERTEYQTMDGGFGIAPVPLYRTHDLEGNPVNDKYLTQIHNLGRIGAVANCSQKFAQASAYLNYQSKNSNDVLNGYYEYELKGKVAQSGENAAGNVAMLDYIRANVRSSFDKVFEDAIGKYFNNVDSSANSNKWHEMIKAAGYKCTDMASRYPDIYLAKQNYLETLKADYESTFQ